MSGAYVRMIEAAIVATLGEVGLEAHARPEDGPDYTGVWVGERKIASIGVHVSRGVTTHGFAVNVHNDLQPFSWVIACGLPDVSMTSLARELAQQLAAVGAQAPMPDATPTPGCWPISDRSALACFRKRMAHSFCRVDERRQRLVSPRRLGIDTANAARRAATRAPIHPNPPAQAEAPAPVQAVPA